MYCTLGHVRFYNAVIPVAALDQNRLFRRIADVPFLVLSAFRISFFIMKIPLHQLDFCKIVNISLELSNFFFFFKKGSKMLLRVVIVYTLYWLQVSSPATGFLEYWRDLHKCIVFFFNYPEL